jgi:acetyl-CoA acetyltransferase
MKNVVIVDSVRTGLAKSHRGGFNMTRPDEMLAHIIDAMLERNPNFHLKMLKILLWAVEILKVLKAII